MRIIQTTGIVKNGEIIVQVPQQLNNGEVDVIVIAKNEPNEFEKIRQLAQAKDCNSQEKILELIHRVKLEMLEEKGRAK